MSLLAVGMCAHAMPMPDSATSPLEVVDRRMHLYNEKNIDAMLELYAADVRVYAYPDRLLGEGRAHLRRVLEDTLKDSTPVEVSHQIGMGRHVISEEHVTYGGKSRRSVSIYEVRDGLICSVRFVRD